MKACTRSNIYYPRGFLNTKVRKTRLSICLSARPITPRLFATKAQQFWVTVYEHATQNGLSFPDLKFDRKYFEDLGKQLEIKTLDDWYNVIPHTRKELAESQKDLLVNGLINSYPEHTWIPWKFTTASKYWNSIEHRKKFFDWLGKELGVTDLDDWYEKLSCKALRENGGHRLLVLHNGSPTAALMSAYPEHNWIPWKFKWAPMGFWYDKENKRKFFDALGSTMGIQKLDDWYHKLSNQLIQDHGGQSMLSGQYNNSAIAALMAAYPEHNWIPWKFEILPHGFWKDKDNQRRFFDYLGKLIGVNTLDDWYHHLNKRLVEEHKGTALIRLYNSSAVQAIMNVYPEHNWVPWRFNTLPKRYWNSTDNIRQFLAELSEKLSIQTLDDWYRVDLVHLHKLGASSVLTKYKRLYYLLKEQYPHHPWDPKRFAQAGKKKGQRSLIVTLQKIFPNDEIIEDYMHPKVNFQASKRPVQLDAFIPSKSLAFEYQGKQHYEEVGVFSPTRTYQQRDEEKRALCAANNIKLIEVPYWWNRTQEELQQIIGGSKLAKM